MQCQVRYVFENATELASAPAGHEGPEGVSAQPAGTARSSPTLQTEDSASGVLTALYSVAEEQSSEVASICRYTLCSLSIHDNQEHVVHVPTKISDLYIEPCIKVWTTISSLAYISGVRETS